MTPAALRAIASWNEALVSDYETNIHRGLTLVAVGLHAVESGMQPLPPTHRFWNPWTRELGSATEVRVFVPIRVVPYKFV